MNEKIAVLLTAFNPDLASLLEKLEQLSRGGVSIILVDNSTDIEVQKSLANETAKLEKVFYLSMGGNKGIAAAQNAAVEKAVLEGFIYFVELDQDTSIDADTIKRLVNSFKAVKTSDPNCFGLGPIAIDSATNLPYHGLKSDQGVVRVKHTLSSGFTFTKDSIQRVGLKDSDLFIDLVDWDWCMRANYEGLNTYINTDIKINHELGEGHISFGFFRLGVPKPFRLYFQYRNLIFLLGRSYVPLIWKIKRTSISMIKIFLFAIIFKDRTKRLKYICKGIGDGVRSYTKPLQSRGRNF